MKWIILGGSFNPPHIGHLLLCEAAAEEFNCGTIFLVPSHISAHKAAPLDASPSDRLRMTRLAVKGNDKFKVEDLEIRRGGVSYSIDTVLELKKKYNLKENPGLMLGDDLLANFRSWKNWEALCREACIIVARRQAGTEGEIDFPHLRINNPLVPVSSSDIRERIRGGRSFRYLVTDSVYSYISRRGLYAGL